MPSIATLPMYDWPERRAHTDARWARLRNALRAEGFDAPDALTRDGDLAGLWLSPDLLVGETCSHPLSKMLAGRVRYVATPLYETHGCGHGTYRSVIVRRGSGNQLPAPGHSAPCLAPAMLSGRFAANEPSSMSGHVGLWRDCHALGLSLPDTVVWTGAHRKSIRAVASGWADFAAIDCHSWSLALEHEPAAAELDVVGWTGARPGLPLVTSVAMDDAQLEALRRAVMAAMPAAVLEAPFEVSPLPDPRP